MGRLIWLGLGVILGGATVGYLMRNEIKQSIIKSINPFAGETGQIVNGRMVWR